ncbi:MAG TPA: ABC transporter ATP-binding protein [Rectinema sp.]|jgi:simple sugar transport system ATP-binding protein|nr:ABC transporter ATP-binding protein [Rectinema sp.]
MDDFISLERIVKVYPPNVLAVNNVSVGIRKGEIHAIIGENGAGKSTLMKILYGLIPFDSGTVRLAGNPVHFKKPADAIAMGIGMVHQEIELISQYAVWENVVLGAEPIQGAIGKLNVKQAIELVRAKIDEFQFNLDPEAIVDRISVAARQKVEILKLLYRNVSVLILDEPTSVLTPQEIPQLFAELKRLRDKGTTILFISHRLDEVLELSDRITVMRKGQKIATVVAAETNKAELAQMMVGRQVIFTSKRTTHKAGECVFETKNLNLVRRDGFKLLDDISFSVHAGEIVGIAGVEGNGQLELVNCVMGLAEPSSGHIEVSNKEITQLPILERRKLISFVPQDRAKMGASISASILENVIMTHHRLNPDFSKWRGLVLNYQTARAFVESLVERFSVQMASYQNPFRSLSGGNQQKAILGRELLLPTPFFLMDQPTRGLDVGSIEYVHDQILSMRKENRAILVISADLEELFLIADRILVMHRGRIVADLVTDQTSIEEVGRYMLEGKLTA